MPTEGERLFARYAHAPNALGYCGPATAAGLQAVACGGGSGVDVPRLARQFSGAWPYQLLIGELTHRDPISHEVGRAYWTGSELSAEVDAQALGELLLTRFASQAGHYWTHLDDGLLAEVTPSHVFHVLGVYPWTRLLDTGLPEPLHVLDSCRIRVGRVVSVTPTSATVEVDTLQYADRTLTLSSPRAEVVERRTPDGVFCELEPGDYAAIHWGLVCDRLTAEETAALLAATDLQLDLTNPRLSRP